jgi:nitroreductase / dihydropteridine reductase
MMRSMIGSKSETDMGHWSKAQAYCALGYAMAQAAYMEIDSCPMEGFFPADVKNILGMSSKETPVAYLAIGVRSDDEKAANPHPKFNFSKAELIVEMK